jgi:hypothetical protein
MMMCKITRSTRPTLTKINRLMESAYIPTDLIYVMEIIDTGDNNRSAT